MRPGEGPLNHYNLDEAYKSRSSGSERTQQCSLDDGDQVLDPDLYTTSTLTRVTPGPTTIPTPGGPQLHENEPNNF
ncbi:unnamed protein product [Peniophora sp. CBMAI 1063]|nr:unnamed protein product [Peniophora sp. CBMAI 1063]